MEKLQTSLKIEENIMLAPLTTLRIGVRRVFSFVQKPKIKLSEPVNLPRKTISTFSFWGGGSNVLFSDEGFDGLVLQIAVKGISVKENIVTAGAGEDWDELVEFCIGRDLAGIECLSGIPGLVGGTPVQNVGAYGQEVSETITKVCVFDRKSKQILELSNSECKFAYRASIFNTSDQNRFIVLSVTYDLKPEGEPKIIYKDLREYFGNKRPTLAETREAVRKIRAEKAMLVRQNTTDANSAGSFFKNPVVSAERFENIVEIAKTYGIESVPGFKNDDNSIKIPAAWLIEQSGFQKGYNSGNAGISTRHTLALINRGNATAKEILSLKNEIQLKVAEKFGVNLIPEPIFAGF